MRGITASEIWSEKRVAYGERELMRGITASEIWSEKRDSLLVRVAYKEGELLFETTRFKCNICKNTNGKYVNMIVLCMVTMIAKMF